VATGLSAASQPASRAQGCSGQVRGWPVAQFRHPWKTGKPINKISGVVAFVVFVVFICYGSLFTMNVLDDGLPKITRLQTDPRQQELRTEEHIICRTRVSRTLQGLQDVYVIIHPNVFMSQYIPGLLCPRCVLSSRSEWLVLLGIRPPKFQRTFASGEQRKRATHSEQRIRGWLTTTRLEIQ